MHGHVFIFQGIEEQVPIENDPVYAAKIVRNYRCAHCSAARTDESVLLKDEFVEEKNGYGLAQGDNNEE
jgi:hypothetical protein